MSVKFYTLGTSHGATERGRSCSVNLVDVDGSYYAFDCGGNIETKMKDLDMPFESLRAVFISHMHEDHIGSLSAVVKRFSHYIKEERSVKVYMPEAEGIEAFRAWVAALHTTKNLHRISYELISAGEIYRDERIAVTAIATRHMQGGAFPSYAFMIEAEGKRILYTGDLAADFSDYPALLLEEDFDLVVSELVHFNLENNLDTIKKTRTKKLVFTHMNLRKAEIIRGIIGEFPFEVVVASDNDSFEP